MNEFDIDKYLPDISSESLPLPRTPEPIQQQDTNSQQENSTSPKRKGKDMTNYKRLVMEDKCENEEPAKKKTKRTGRPSKASLIAKNPEHATARGRKMLMLDSCKLTLITEGKVAKQRSIVWSRIIVVKNVETFNLFEFLFSQYEKKLIKVKKIMDTTENISNILEKLQDNYID